jgi:hypothetical protein
LKLGRDEEGRDITLPVANSSLLVTGEPGEKPQIAAALLDRLSKAGYQFCAIDTRGDYIDFTEAVVFGTMDAPPSIDDVVSGLARPDVQVVVCLAAMLESQRPKFLHELLGPIRELRERTGRPHWILLDEANELLPAGAQEESPTHSAAENTLYVSADPAALAPEILSCADGIAAGGPNARAALEAFAASQPGKPPVLPGRAPRQGESLVWYRRTERPVALVDLARSRPDIEAPLPHAEKSTEVGQVLRRA